MKVWHFLPLISAPMPFQMTVDETLFRSRLEAAEKEILPPILRFYLASEPWISVGYSGSADAPEGGIPVCRRITGGGRVLHGKDLIFSLVAHKGAHESFREVRASYVAIHTAVKLGLEKAGRKPRFYRCTENLPKGGDCFRFPIPSDLAVDGRKAAGGAQKRSRGILLHQESVQFEGMDRERLREALETAFAEVFGVSLIPQDLDPELIL
ncbi:MAG: hypothetical protein WC352_04970 [Candidatus Omnitrophota bacterium]|jgi:lipoate-protein ligase A